MKPIRDELLDTIDKVLSRASDQRSKIRKRVESGVSHESHLAYADGLVAGLEDARAAIVDAYKEGDCRDVPN